MDGTANQGAGTSAPIESLPLPELPPVEIARPFAGFDREREIYQSIKGQLLEDAAGKYVVIVGSEVIGPIDRFEEALKAGYRRFGAGPLFVKQVLAEEPVVELSRSIDPCPI
jgi:hypothetical protein